MSNRGYPDDDGSRDPGGVHGEGRQSGTSLYNVERMMTAATIADMPASDHISDATDDAGANKGWGCEVRYPVDGDANTNPSGRSTADYPAWTSTA